MTTFSTEVDAPEYVTIKDAAAAMDRTPWDVYRLAAAGELQTVRFGQRLLVRAYDVEQLGGVL